MRVAVVLAVLCAVALADAPEPKPAPVAVIVVIDRSPHMKGGPLEAATIAATALAASLRPDDLVGVIAFADDAEVVMPLSRVADYKTYVKQIDALSVRDGSRFGPPLAEARRMFKDVKLRKHVIVIAGSTSSEGFAQPLGDLVATKATVSAVGLAYSDRQQLAEIAERGNARLYMLEDVGALPKIAIKEARELAK